MRDPAGIDLSFTLMMINRRTEVKKRGETETSQRRLTVGRQEGGMMDVEGRDCWATRRLGVIFRRTAFANEVEISGSCLKYDEKVLTWDQLPDGH